MNFDGQRSENHDSRHPSPRSRHWIVAFVAAAILGAVGLGSLPDRDIEPLTQQHSIGGELNYLLTHRAALWHLLPFAIVYLIVLAFYSFTSHLINRLGPRWTNEFADAFDAWLRTLLSRFYSRYRKNLYYHLRSLDQKGIPDPGPWSLDLEQVFVDLEIEPQALSDIQANPVQRLQSALRKGSHHFFDFLSPRGGEHPHLVVVGPPGSGKTTMLRYTTLILLSGRRAQRRAKMPAQLRRSVPILLYLREHAAQIEAALKPQRANSTTSVSSSTYSLEHAVNDHLRQHAPDLKVPKGWLLRRLRYGRCLVLLDGLDEISDGAQRQVVATWVQEQIDQYSACRFVVTSRPHGYRGNTLNGVTVLGTRPFTAGQMQAFVRNWYHATEKRQHGNQDDRGVRQEARLSADKLLHRIQELPDLNELASNPLLLTMVCTVHLYKGSLPNRRVDLYKDACEVLLVARQRAKGLPIILTENQAVGVLAPLAWAMMSIADTEAAKDGRRWPKSYVVQSIAEAVAQRTDMNPDTFLQYAQESGLYLELEPGEYGFAHLTFQEYLAARYALNNEDESALIMHIGDTWWEETIRLYCAQADPLRARNIIEACLPQGDALPTTNALVLALACLDEAPAKARSATESRVQEQIDRCVEAPDTERQHIAADVLLAKRLREMTYETSYLTDTTRFSPSLITCAEYQLFVDEAQARGEDRTPPHWESTRYPSGTGLAAALGVLAEDAVAFCSWLTERRVSKGRVFRIPSGQEARMKTVQRAIQQPDFPGEVWITGTENSVELTRTIRTPRTDARLGRLEGFVATLRQDTSTAGVSHLFSVIHDRIISTVDTRYLAHGNHLATARALAHVSMHDAKLNNALAKLTALFGDVTINRILAYGRASDLADAIATILIQDADLATARGLTNDFVSSLSVAGSHAHAITNRLRGALPNVTARHESGGIAVAIAVSDASINVCELASSLARILASPNARDLALDLVSILVGAGVVALVLRDSSDIALARGLAGEQTDLQRTLRISMLTLAGSLSPSRRRPKAAGRLSHLFPSRTTQASTQAYNQAFEQFVDLYVAFLVMKCRNEGWLQPVEGILLACDLPAQPPERTHAPASTNESPPARIPGHHARLPGHN